MIIKINILLKICFFIFLSIFLIWQSLDHPRILVVQSYANDFSWTRNIDAAIRRGLENRGYDIRYFYMDTKTHSDVSFKQMVASRVKKQIKMWSPHVLIAVDDNAQSLVSSCYVNVSTLPLSTEELVLLRQRSPDLGLCYLQQPEMKIIFSGVGAQPKDYGFIGQSHIGGILDPIDVDFLSNSLQLVKNRLAKQRLKIIAPVDDSVTSKYNIRNSLNALAQALKPLNIDLEYKMVSTLVGWQQVIKEADQQADLLLFTLYHTIRCRGNDDARRISPQKLIQWTLANSQIPAIGTYGFFVEDGGLFSLGVSPLEQGDEAAKMAVDYLELGIYPSDMEMQVQS